MGAASAGGCIGLASLLGGLPGGLAGGVLGRIPLGEKKDTAKAPPEENEASGSAPSKGQSKLESGSASAEGAEASLGESVKRSWWQFLTGWVSRRDGGGDGEAAEAAKGAMPGDGGVEGAAKPVEAIIIPPDLPIEEIAM